MQLAQATYIGDSPAQLSALDTVFSNVVQVVLGLAAIALFIMLLVGGFQYITSGGDPKTAEAAKQTLTHAILGMVLVASVYLILRLISAITGVDVTNFSIVGQPVTP